MAYATAQPTRKESIPIVDLSELRDNRNPDKVAAALHSASQNLGFIYVSNHGIPTQTIDKARNCAFQFFRQSDEEKTDVLVSTKHRGWLKPGASKMDDNANPDLKESFIWGLQDSQGYTVEDHPLRGANQWPVSLPSMESAAMAYFHAAHDVAFLLMRGFARGLNLDEHFFLQTCSLPLSRASFVYYPPQPESYGEHQFGVAPHTDFGVLTVLCQDDTGGLQIQDSDGRWIHAPPIDGSLIVNVGDLLCRWTGGAYKSTPHRVVNTSGKERLSLVLAFDPNPETLIDANAIPGLSSDDPPINCGDYLQWRFAKAFSYRKQSVK